MYRYILRESCSQFDSLPLTFDEQVEATQRRSSSSEGALPIQDIDRATVLGTVYQQREEAEAFEVQRVVERTGWSADHARAAIASTGSVVNAIRLSGRT